MLTLTGIPEPVVALNRIVGTVAGGLSALIVHSAWAASERWRIQKKARPARTMHRVDVGGH